MDLLLSVFVIFLVFKLAGTIDWSWWWVFSPLILEVVIEASVVLWVAFETWLSKRQQKRLNLWKQWGRDYERACDREKNT